MRSKLELAIKIAVDCHRDQKDKQGVEYILHPLAVMMMGETREEMIVGVLHDVVEDTDCTIESLWWNGFGATIIDAIDAITKREGESYREYIERVKRNDLARRVKINDIKHNLRPGAPESLYDRYRKTLKELS